MDKVYVVTEGCYSDYHIAGIFSNRELAEKMKTALYEGNDIEEHPLDQINPKIMQGYKLYSISSMDRDGNTEEVALGDSYNYSDFINEMKNKNYGYRFIEYNGKDTWDFYIWAKDEVHAIKIANEYRIQLIENDLWNKATHNEKMCFD